ncbi:deoxyribose-phosphate aldolase, partial [Streptomyces sp. 2MCAF27]
VLLGGDVGKSPRDQEGAYEKWRKALSLPTVQGLVVGRALLYPAEGSVEQAVDTAVGLL